MRWIEDDEWVGGIAALAGILVGVLLFLALVGLAHAQTAPASFCGKASVALPRLEIITSGARYATQSVSNAAISSPTLPVLTTGSIVGALVIVETATIRERHDGTAPTNLGGTQYGPGGAGGTVFTVCGSDLATGPVTNATVNLKLTGESSTAALVHYWFYIDGR